MGGTLNEVGFDLLACVSTPGPLRGSVGPCGCVGWGFTGAHYWVLEAQTLCRVSRLSLLGGGVVSGVGDGFLACGGSTCCGLLRDRPYVENYTVDASIFEAHFCVSYFYGLSMHAGWCVCSFLFTYVISSC